MSWIQGAPLLPQAGQSPGFASRGPYSILINYDTAKAIVELTPEVLVTLPEGRNARLTARAFRLTDVGFAGGIELPESYINEAAGYVEVYLDLWETAHVHATGTSGYSTWDLVRVC